MGRDCLLAVFAVNGGRISVAAAIRFRAGRGFLPVCLNSTVDRAGPFTRGRAAIGIVLPGFLPAAPHFPERVDGAEVLAAQRQAVPSQPVEAGSAVEGGLMGLLGCFCRGQLFVLGQQGPGAVQFLIDDSPDECPCLVRVARSIGNLAPVHDAAWTRVDRTQFPLEMIPDLLARAARDHVPGQEDGVERRVVDGLDHFLALKPDEAETVAKRPPGLVVEQVVELAPASEKPTASLLGLFEPVQQHGRVVIARWRAGDGRFPLIGRIGAAEKHAPKLAGLFKPPRGRLADLGPDPAQAILNVVRLGLFDLLDRARQPCRMSDQLGLVDLPRPPRFGPAPLLLGKAPGVFSKRAGNNREIQCVMRDRINGGRPCRSPFARSQCSDDWGNRDGSSRRNHGRSLLGEGAGRQGGKREGSGRSNASRGAGRSSNRVRPIMRDYGENWISNCLFEISGEIQPPDCWRIDDRNRFQAMAMGTCKASHHIRYIFMLDASLARQAGLRSALSRAIRSASARTSPL